MTPPALSRDHAWYCGISGEWGSRQFMGLQQEWYAFGILTSATACSASPPINGPVGR